MYACHFQWIIIFPNNIWLPLIKIGHSCFKQQAKSSSYSENFLILLSSWSKAKHTEQLYLRVKIVQFRYQLSHETLLCRNCKLLVIELCHLLYIMNWTDIYKSNLLAFWPQNWQTKLYTRSHTASSQIILFQFAQSALRSPTAQLVRWLATEWEELGLRAVGLHSLFTLLAWLLDPSSLPSNGYQKLPGKTSGQSMVLTTSPPSYVEVKETVEPCLPCPNGL